MFEKAYEVWIVYYEPTAENLAVCESAGAAHLWIHENVASDMQAECYVESKWMYCLFKK